jgi:8-oxo-dGTP pyrophosphatase MutT (NUDIX family)
MDLRFPLEPGVFELRSSALIVSPARGVLMVTSELTDYYYSVGGAVEFGESSVDAMRRETREETGLEIVNPRLVGIVENFFCDKALGARPWQNIEFYYRVDLADPEAEPVAAGVGFLGNEERLAWVPLAEVPGLVAAHKLFPLAMMDLLNAKQPLHIVSREPTFDEARRVEGSIVE